MEKIEFTLQEDLEKTLENLRILIANFLGVAIIVPAAFQAPAEFSAGALFISCLLTLKYLQTKKYLEALTKDQTPATTEQTTTEPSSSTR